MKVSRRKFLATSAYTLAGAALAGCSGPRRLGQRALDGLPSPPEGLPNVLLIVLDTVRSQSLSLYGYERPTTPNLQNLAKESTVFDMAIASAPWTLPSHATMFTGKYPFQLFDSWWIPMDSRFPTLAEVLGEAGFFTAGFVANLIYCSRDHGLNRGFQHYEDFPVSIGQALSSSRLSEFIVNRSGLRKLTGYDDVMGRKTADHVNRDFLAWLDRKSEDGRPFFAFLNYYDAHDPYLPPEEFAAEFRTAKARRRLPAMTHEMEPEDIRYLQDAYDGAIAYLDDRLERLFSELRRRDIMENTIVIVTSDHGEHFGEHDLVGHGNSLYIQLLRVPLLVYHPGTIPAGRRISAPVSLQSLPATISDLLGFGDQSLLPGSSLRTLWAAQGGSGLDDSGVIRSEVHHNSGMGESPVSRGALRSLIRGKYHYIRSRFDGSEELYDLSRDFEEENDLSDSYPKALQEFRRHLEVLT